jgi:hypothetical protein
VVGATLHSELHLPIMSYKPLARRTLRVLCGKVRLLAAIFSLTVGLSSSTSLVGLVRRRLNYSGFSECRFYGPNHLDQ